MKSALSILLVLAFAFTAPAQNQDWQSFMNQSAYQRFAVMQDQEQPEPDSAVVTVTAAEIKSPGKAALFSALLPGAGQFYNESYWQAGICLAIEALSWTAWAMYDKKGDDIKAEFRQFADTHWIEADYWTWISDRSGLTYDPDSTAAMNALRAWEQKNYSHGLHKQKDQQYYEMIGKYDQFNYGWDDSDIGLNEPGWSKSLRSTRRLHYEDRRYDSNRAYKNANWGITLVLLNHILSAAQAAFVSKRHNDRLAVNLNVEPRLIDNRLYSCLKLRLAW